MTQKELKISMLGEYRMQFSNKKWMQKGKRSQKTQILLSMLLCNMGKSVSQEKLMELLWPDAPDNMNLCNALKNQIYRIRRCLNEVVGKKTQFIIFSKNAYAWNTTIPFELDVDQLEQISHLRVGDTKNLLELYKKAINLYQGEFMENIAGQDWVYGKRSYYENLFVNCVIQLCKLLDAQDKNFEVITVCESALLKCPFQEEIHQILLKSYIKTHRHQKALEHYKSISEAFSRELGVGLPDSIHRLYNDIIQDIHWVETDVEYIKNRILSIPAERKAFLCEYPVFEQLCLVQLRSKSRSNQNLILVLLTVKDQEGNVPPLEKLKHMMQALQNCILDTLRKNDLVSRYSPSQFVLGLMVTNADDGKIVMRRVRSVFSQRFCKEGIEVGTQIVRMDRENQK